MPDRLTDLIQRAQKGDPATIGELYERFHLKIYRYLFYRVGDPYTAEDLTSEVFLKMLRFLDSYKPGKASFQAWLFQIARNIAIDDYRKNGSRVIQELDESIYMGKDNTDQAVEEILNNENLRQAMSQLTEDQRDVIVMRFISGMPIQDVARSVHKSEDAVKGLQRRGLIALREILEQWEIPYAESR